ncbi:hypothetical protein EDB80DRAFT_108648 [Ilyonectria destructans]|nr:hypothetical protein EDB80DRAFT_108648 [Ilyonectria destructans]
MHHPPAFDSWTRPLTNLNPNLPNATPVNYVVHRRLTSDSDLPATYNILRPSRVLATLPPQRQGSSSLSFVPPRFTCPLLRASVSPRRCLDDIIILRFHRIWFWYVRPRSTLGDVARYLQSSLLPSARHPIQISIAPFLCIVVSQPTLAIILAGPVPLPAGAYLRHATCTSAALLCSVPSCLTVPRSLSWSLSSSALFPLIIPSAFDSWTGRRALPSQAD